MPKCGGTSVLKILRETVPTLSEDYVSYFRIPVEERRRAVLNQASIFANVAPAPEAFIFGHFFPVKYIESNYRGDYTMVTIIRDPIDRLISHYRYWSVTPDTSHYLCLKMHEENWDFSKFAFSPEMKNFYAQYFTGITLADFSYIGLYENYDTSVRTCLKILGVNLPEGASLPYENVTKSEFNVGMTSGMWSELRDFHAEDYAIYDFAKRGFALDRNEAGPKPYSADDARAACYSY